MIQIDDTDYEQPSDKSIVAYNGGKYVLISSGDLIQRVLMSEFLASPLPAHDHDNEYLYPWVLAACASRDSIIVSNDSASPSYIRIYKQEVSSGVMALRSPLSHINLSPFGRVDIIQENWSPVLWITGPTPGDRTAIADAWTLYPCSRAEKTDIEVISDPLDKIARAEGVTFTQEGFENIGIPAEDLDLLDLPYMTKKGLDGKYEGVNPVSVVPLLLEGIKALLLRVEALEAITE